METAAAKADRIHGAIRAIPAGLVATYGQVAMLAEIPRGHRVVAAALEACDPALDLPPALWLAAPRLSAGLGPS